MKILVTGTKGQVSRCLQDRAALHEDIELVAVGRPELDLLKPEAIGRVIAAHKPDIVVSAAAYTAVDQAEDEPDIAYAVNEIGAGAVAAAAKAIGSPVIHLSTDYVFSGDLDRPYTEDDIPDPKSVYGASKLAGERAVMAANDRHIILRTAWVYSPYGKNFVTTMLRLAETRDEIAVVNDQFGNPTSASDIADIIIRISTTVIAADNPSYFGVFHACTSLSATWYCLANRIFEIRNARENRQTTIIPITSLEFRSKAMRPHNSCLDSTKLDSVYHTVLPDWKSSLPIVIKSAEMPNQNNNNWLSQRRS